MSKDPTPNPPPKAGAQESLEDSIYRSSLAEGNTAVRGANPVQSALFTLVSYGLMGGLAWLFMTQTSMGKKIAEKTAKLVDVELKQDEEPPPPPPPPPPAAPAAPVVKVEVPKSDAPPPPPPDPSKEQVPDVAPKEMPKRDLSTAYAVQGTPGSGPAGGVAGGGVAGTGGMSLAGAGGGSSRVVDVAFENMKIKVKPPAPPYPPIAKLAKIQGTVVVEIVVGTDGVPVSAKAVEGPPQLRPASEAYALTWRFEPAMVNGQPVQSRFRLTMPYKLV